MLKYSRIPPQTIEQIDQAKIVEQKEAHFAMVTTKEQEEAAQLRIKYNINNPNAPDKADKDHYQEFLNMCLKAASPNLPPTFEMPQDVKVLQKGLGVKRNAVNGFTVIYLHYTADPAKDPETPEGLEWYLEAISGLDAKGIAKEYEIDFFAKCGGLIYPEFEEKNLIEPFEIPHNWTRYMTFDPGVRNPCAMLWAAVSPAGDIYLYDEYYQSGKGIEDHIEAIKIKEQQSKSHIYRRGIDMTSNNKSQITNTSVREELHKGGFYFELVINNATAAIAKIKKWFSVDPKTNRPKLYVFKTLTHFRYEAMNYRWQEVVKVTKEVDPAEMPEKLHDHLMNCLEYLAHMDIKYTSMVYTDGKNNLNLPLVGGGFSDWDYD